MTSSYGYQRPLSNEEQLFLQNQALRAELQRREGEQNALDAVAKTALTVGGLALGAAGARSLLRRGKTPISTRGVTVTDLGSIPTEDVRRASTTSARTVEVATSPRPAPSQPAPKTYSERLAQNEEFTRRALAERPQPVRQGNLSELVKQVNIQDLGPVEQKRLPAAKEFLQQRLTGQKTDLPTARTPGTFQEFSREASGVAAAERLAQDPELLSLVKAQEAQELSEARSFQAKAQAEYRNLISAEADEVIGTLRKEANTVQAAAESDFGPQSYLQSEGYIAADNLVDQHQARVLGRIDQFANAANPAEDQATGRVKMALQRNEDVNLAVIEMAEDAVDSQIAKAAQGDPTVASVTDLDSAINQAASTLPDGLPLDQAERLPKDPWSGSATVPGPQRSIASSIETKLLPSAAVSPREKSQQFLQQRFEELGAVVPSPTRRERILSADPALAEAYELYASTGDPSVLSRLSEAPSSPINVTLKEQSEFVSPEVATKSLYKPGVYPEYVGDLIEKDIELTNQISSLSQEKLNIAARQKELGEQELMLKNAMAQEPVGRDSYSRMLGKVKYEQQNLPSPESLNVDIGDAMAERDFTRVQLESAENLGPQYKLISREEGTRAFYEQTPEGQIIPETLEVRGGRPSVELELKKGGGRGAAEYDPSGQTGSKKGTYGIESTKYPQTTSAQRPTQYTADELVQEALEQATASLEGDVPIPPPKQQVSRQFGPRASKQSLVASEIVRRAMIEGRDVKEALRKGGFGI